MSGSENPLDSDIAVIGYAAHLPGARDVAGFWRALCAGEEAVHALSEEDLRQAGVPESEYSRPDYVRSAATLDGLADFDPSFFGLSPKEAAIMDPQHRRFLACCWQAFEHGAQDPAQFAGSVGVFAGCGMNSYFMFNLLRNPQLVEDVGLFLLRHTGNDKDFLSTRASYVFDLRGPSVNIQTACSTSLVAVHQACQSLLANECDMALAGGSTIELPHGRGYLYREKEILASDGHCRPFDESASGTLFGSGAGVVLLRRLSDAIADGDPIRAVIKASAVNNDGAAKVGYLAPSVDGQAAAVAEALALCDFPAESIGYVEAHGTATPIGDPIEVAALTRAFREHTEATGFCKLGSVKGNIGHLDTAAGVAGLIKTIRALEEGVLPPSLHFEKPLPELQLEQTPFAVVQKQEEWSADGPRRAAVNSLGVGGTNAFVILEQAPQSQASRAQSSQEEKPVLLPLSAQNPDALTERMSDLAGYLEEHPQTSLPQLASTLVYGRHEFAERAVLAVRSVAEAQQCLTLAAKGEERLRAPRHRQAKHTQAPVFLFPGGGASVVGAAQGMEEAYPVFAEVLAEGDRLLQEHHQLSLLPLLRGEGNLSETDALEPEQQLPALFLLEVALAKQSQALGLEARALVGLSLGELTAAHLAGVFDFADALHLVVARARLFHRLEKGAMLSVSMSQAELEAILPKDLDLAVESAPDLSVVSGPIAAVQDFEKTLLQAGHEAIPIPLSTAAHTHLLDPVLESWREAVMATQRHAPTIPVLSNRSGAWLTAEQATSVEYWVEQLRQRVRFRDGAAFVLEELPQALALEMGPGQTLCGLLQLQEQNQGDLVTVPCLGPTDGSGGDPAVAYTTALGRVWAEGGPLLSDFAPQQPSAQCPRLTLPGYPFQEQRYWIDAIGEELTPAEKAMPEVTRHDSIDNFFSMPIWEASSLPEKPPALTPGTRWLILEDELGFGRQLSHDLREHGQQVLSVQQAPRNARLDNNTWLLDSDRGAEGFEALVEDLVERDEIPNRIINLWTLTGAEEFRTALNRFAHNLERGFFSHFHLLQEMARRDLLGSVHLLTVTNGARQVGKEMVPDPEKAAIDGLRLVAPHEQAGFQTAALDVQFAESSKASRAEQGAAMTQESVLECLREELFAPAQTGCFAIREQQRYRRHLGRRGIHLPQVQRPVVEPNGVYLLTGGLGGMALSLAAAMAEEAPVTLLLVSRRGLQEGSPEAQSVEALRAKGSTVVCAAVDITDHEDLQHFLGEAQAEHGPVRGIIHAAGVIQDDLLAMKTAQQIQEVFAAKIYGTLVLDMLFRTKKLDFFHLCSSTSIWIGPAGQADYVAANAWLAAYAAARRHRLGEETVAIDWGVWSEVGMAANASRTRDQEHRRVLDASQDWVIAEHEVGGLGKVLPGTGAVEMLAMVEGSFQPQCLQEILFLRPLVVAADAPRHIRLFLGSKGDSGERPVKLQSHTVAGGRPGWLTHAEAIRLTAAPKPSAPLDLPVLAARCPRASVAATGEAGLTTALEESGRLRFGPRWRSLRMLRFGEDEALARLQLPSEFVEDLNLHPLHPALLDMAIGCGWDLIPAFRNAQASWLPAGIERLEILAPLVADLCAHVRLLEADDQSARFAVIVTNEAGEVLLRLHGLRVIRVGEPSLPSVSADDLEVHQESSSSPVERALDETIARGITVAEGQEAWRRLRRTEPPTEVVVSSLDLHALKLQADALALAANVSAEEGSRFERPSLETPFAAPQSEMEREIQELWQDLLGIDGLGIDDDFFALGGHSLIAVRLFSRLRSEYGKSYAISLLFEAPTVRALAQRLSADLRPEAELLSGTEGESSSTSSEDFQPLVPIQPEGSKHPLFIAAGKGGNAMNLRHLALRLEPDQPFYGIQHRGFDGQHEPHKAVEEMAQEVIAAIQKVQPHGPYHLGGFSAGGLLAFEMAQQLIAAGESIGLLTFFDTPAPNRFEVGKLSRIRMHTQELFRRGPRYLVDKMKRHLHQQPKPLGLELSQQPEGEQQPLPDPGPTGFDDSRARVAAAWLRMENRYTAHPFEGSMVLFRPYMAGNEDWSPFLNRDEQNGWGNLIRGGIEVYELPGGHATMCEEPHVRIFAKHLNRVLARTQSPRPAPTVD